MSDRLDSRLGQIEIQDVQSRVYPHDAFEFENPGRYTTQPKVTLKSPWRLYGRYRPTVHSVASDDYTITDIDGYDLILVTTGADARTITLPTVADNTDRIIKVMKADSGAGKVVLDGEGAEAIIQVGGTSFATMEMFYQGDFIEVISDGTNWLKLNPCEWKRIPDPPTGWKATKTSWAATDDFSQGLEVTYSEVATGSLAVDCVVLVDVGPAWTYYRPSGDSGISNTPFATGESSHLIGLNDDFATMVNLWLSSDYKVQFTMSSVGSDLYVAYPSGFYV